MGEIRGTVLQKHARKSIHALREPAAWCWDADILTEAQEAGVVTVLVIDDESKWKYTASLDDFIAHGIEFDRGHDAQVCLPLKFWNTRPPRGWKREYREFHEAAVEAQQAARSKKSAKNKPTKPDTGQLSLFGGKR